MAFIPASPTLVSNTYVENKTGNHSFIVPRGNIILGIIGKNMGATLVNGLKLGTTDGGAEVATNLLAAVTGSFYIPSSQLNQQILYNEDADRTLYVTLLSNLLSSGAPNLYYRIAFRSML